mmetsp:Transcript_5884/g.14736  ORF Transcript_5884/g.14736 Transcript_5884/m.14736 type:complete len:114 (+) Transcript_5884:246-587(+)
MVCQRNMLATKTIAQFQYQSEGHHLFHYIDAAVTIFEARLMSRRRIFARIIHLETVLRIVRSIKVKATKNVNVVAAMQRDARRKFSHHPVHLRVRHQQLTAQTLCKILLQIKL